MAEWGNEVVRNDTASGGRRSPRPFLNPSFPHSLIPSFPHSLIPPLRSQPVHQPRKRDHLAHVLDPADPCDRALQPEPEAGMREGAVAAQVEVPLVGLAIE